MEATTMNLAKHGFWIALGTGIGAAFGSAGVLPMGPAVAWGVAGGVVAALIKMRMRGEDLCG